MLQRAGALSTPHDEPQQNRSRETLSRRRRHKMALSKLTLAPARTLLRQAARGMARKPIVGGNWKCNPATASSLDELCRNFDGVAPYLDKCDVYVCP